MISGLQAIGDSFNQNLAATGGFASSVAGQPSPVSGMSAAYDQMSALAGSSGNSALKMSLAQDNISLTDHSDVGAGQRFETAGDKLSHIMGRKAALMLEMRMAMVSSGSWGASNNEEIKSIRGGSVK